MMLEEEIEALSQKKKGYGIWLRKEGVKKAVMQTKNRGKKKAPYKV